jgi:hypothetical protein
MNTERIDKITSIAMHIVDQSCEYVSLNKVWSKENCFVCVGVAPNWSACGTRTSEQTIRFMQDLEFVRSFAERVTIVIEKINSLEEQK